MIAEVISHDGEELTIQVKVKITGSLLEAEHTILDACNEVGRVLILIDVLVGYTNLIYQATVKK